MRPGPARHETSPQRRIGTALVGTGQRARDCYASAMLQNPNMHLRALWSRSQLAADRFNLEVAGCSLQVFHGETGFEQLLSQPEIEAVVVALPSGSWPYLVRILASGKHVLSESPVATDRAAAEETIRWLEGFNMDGLVWFISEPLAYEAVFQPETLNLQ
ncbi:unnamed protein product, partial [Polarella glacialis]